jgi:hypothetical protein
MHNIYEYNFNYLVKLEKQTIVSHVKEWIKQNSFIQDEKTNATYPDNLAQVYCITLNSTFRSVHGRAKIKQAHRNITRFRTILTKRLEISRRPQARLKHPKLYLFPDAIYSKCGLLVDQDRFQEDPHHHGIILIPGAYVKAFEELIRMYKWDSDKPQVPNSLNFLSSINIEKLSSAELEKWLDYSMKFQVQASKMGYYDVEPYIYPDPFHNKKKPQQRRKAAGKMSKRPVTRRTSKTRNSAKMGSIKNAFI